MILHQPRVRHSSFRLHPSSFLPYNPPMSHASAPPAPAFSPSPARARLLRKIHGAGLMLVPALASMCLADNPAREITASGSLLLALSAVGVHTAAMMATTGVIAAGVCRGVAMHPRLLSGKALRQAWTAALAVTGVLLMVLR